MLRAGRELWYGGAGHYEVSTAVAENALLPALRSTAGEKTVFFSPTV